MNPLLITTLFLILLSLFSFNAQKKINSLFHLENIQKSRHELSELSSYLEQRAYYEKKCSERTPSSEHIVKPAEVGEPIQEENEKKINPKRKTSTKRYRSKPLNYDFSRPPNDSRFNIKKIIEAKNIRKAEPNVFCQIFTRLLRQLYKEHPAFLNSPDIEYRIIEELTHHCEHVHNLRSAEDLSCLQFKNPELQQLFYSLLKGGSLAKIEVDGKSSIVYFPSLLSYVTIHRAVKINLLFAPPELILATIPHSDLVSEILEIRQHLWNEIIQQERERKSVTEEVPLTRTTIKLKFSEQVKVVLEKKGLDKNKEIVSMLGYGLGKPGDFLVVRDEKTGLLYSHRLTDNFSSKVN